WTDMLGNFIVAGNQARAGGLASTNMAIVNGATNATTNVSVTVGTLADGQFAGVVGRYVNNNTMYFAGVQDTGGVVTAQIWRLIGGVPKKIATSSTLLSFSGSIRFNITGTSLKLFVDNAQVASVVDANIASGRIGIRGSMGTSFGNFSA